MLPQTNHPTAFSVMRSDNPTVLNVLVDMVNFVLSCGSLGLASILFLFYK